MPSTYATNLNKIYLLQKHVVLALNNSEYHAHSAPLFAKFKILHIFSVTTFHIAKFMFSYHHLLLPFFYLRLFITGDQLHVEQISNSLLSRIEAQKFGIFFQHPSQILLPVPLSKHDCMIFCFSVQWRAHSYKPNLCFFAAPF